MFVFLDCVYLGTWKQRKCSQALTLSASGNSARVIARRLITNLRQQAAAAPTSQSATIREQWHVSMNAPTAA